MPPVQSVPAAPTTLRTIVFIDGENLRKTCYALFGWGWCHPIRLAEELVGIRPRRQLDQVRYYSGVHDSNRFPDRAAKMTRRLNAYREQGVHVETRTLKYALEWMVDEESGSDSGATRISASALPRCGALLIAEVDENLRRIGDGSGPSNAISRKGLGRRTRACFDERDIRGRRCGLCRRRVAEPRGRAARRVHCGQRGGRSDASSDAETTTAPAFELGPSTGCLGVPPSGTEFVLEFARLPPRRAAA